MYEEEVHCRNRYLNGFGIFDTGILDLWPSDHKMDVMSKFEEGRQGILELLNGNGFGTFDPGNFDLDPVTIIKRVHLLPKADVWTRFE